jgi:hypothetical protein
MPWDPHFHCIVLEGAFRKHSGFSFDHSIIVFLDSHSLITL